MKIQVPGDRVKYLQRKVKEAVNSSSTPDHQLNTSSNEKTNEDW